MRANPECKSQPEISANIRNQLAPVCLGQTHEAVFIARHLFAIPVFGLNPFFMSKEYQGVVLLPSF